MKENIFYGEKSSVINPSTEPFGIIVGHFGYERTLPTKEVVTSEGYHTFRLHYIVKGSVFYSYNGKEKRIKRNSCFLLSPQSVSYYKTNPKNPAVIFWTSYSGMEALRITELMGFTEDAEGVIVLSAKQKNAMLSLMSNALKPTSTGLTEIVLLKNFTSIVEFLATTGTNETLQKIKQPKMPSSHHIETALKYIEMNYSNPYLSLEDVASAIPIHKNYLSLLFKKSLGVTFTQYLTQKRIEQATVLLKNTDYTISQISNSVGYVDQLYFSKLFKKFNKLPPSEYRKNISLKQKDDTPPRRYRTKYRLIAFYCA